MPSVSPILHGNIYLHWTFKMRCKTGEVAKNKMSKVMEMVEVTYFAFAVSLIRIIQGQRLVTNNIHAMHSTVPHWERKKDRCRARWNLYDNGKQEYRNSYGWYIRRPIIENWCSINNLSTKFMDFFRLAYTFVGFTFRYNLGLPLFPRFLPIFRDEGWIIEIWSLAECFILISFSACNSPFPFQGL